MSSLLYEILYDFALWWRVHDRMRQHNIEITQRGFPFQKQDYIPAIHLKPDYTITFLLLDVSGRRLARENNCSSHHLPFPFISLSLSLSLFLPPPLLKQSSITLIPVILPSIFLHLPGPSRRVVPSGCLRATQPPPLSVNTALRDWQLHVQINNNLQTV